MIEKKGKDRRYKRTKYVIRRAFEELISEKDVNDITITGDRVCCKYKQKDILCAL